jgi:hypothetical protein
MRENGEAYFRRERSLAQAMLLPIANGMMRSMNTNIAILRGSEWKKWEINVYAMLHSVVVRTSPRGLEIPKLPGHVLADYLAGRQSIDEKRLALKICLSALCAGHRRVVPWPDGLHRTFSHADATARNVLYEPVSQAAHWIDFETLHSALLSDDERHADDLRAFIISSVETWPEAADHLPELIFDDSLIASNVRGILLAKLRLGPANLYEEAQGSIPDRSLARLLDLSPFAS